MPLNCQYRGRFCSALLPAWLPVAKRPEASMLLYHLGQDHRAEVGPYLRRMESECIEREHLELFEVAEGADDGI